MKKFDVYLALVYGRSQENRAQKVRSKYLLDNGDVTVKTFKVERQLMADGHVPKAYACI